MLTLVLMGSTTPWLSELADMGINYLAGVAITDADALRQTIAEGEGLVFLMLGYNIASYSYIK